MTWAQEMKNLAADIKSSHHDRTARLSEIKDETKEIRRQGQQVLKDADAFMKDVRAELTQAAKDLKDFLSRSEETRKENFKELMAEIRQTLKDIQIRVRTIRGEAKNFLTKAEKKRMDEFNNMMRDIKGDLGAIKRSVGELLKSTKNLIGGYAAERKEAAGYWDRLGGKEEVAPTEHASPKPRKKGRRKKK